MNNIIERDFRKIDLNLLLVFRAVLLERNVTRAAQRLFLGQPAVSGALKRLRAALGDELFVRTPHGVEPTPRALELAALIEPLLAALHSGLMQKPSFEPAQARHVFRLGLSDSLEITLLPMLMQRLAREAPGVRIITRAADTPRAAAMLDAGEIELAIGAHRSAGPRLHHETLFRWRFVTIYDARHIRPRGARLSLAEFIRHRHVLTSFSASLSGHLDEALARVGRQRTVVLSSPHFATTPFVVRDAPYLATVPDFIARRWCAALGLAQSPVPLDLPEYEIAVLGKQAGAHDPALNWLIATLKTCVADDATRKGGR